MNTGGKLSGMDFVRLRLTDLGSVSSFLPGFWVDYKWLSSPGTESFPFVVFQLLSQTPLFTTPWTVAHQAPLSMGSSRQEYRNTRIWFPFPPSPDFFPPRDHTQSFSMRADAHVFINTFII